MITGITAVINWLSSILYTITHLTIPTGINNTVMDYGVVIIFMFLLRIAYKTIKMFLSKDHNRFASNGKD